MTMSKGCLIWGTTVVTNGTGTYPLSTAPNNELYNGQGIHLRTWQYDPICGLTKVNNNGSLGQCLVKSSLFSYWYGNVVTYSEQDNTCVDTPPVNQAPMDGLVYLVTGCIMLWLSVKYRPWQLVRNQLK